MFYASMLLKKKKKSHKRLFLYSNSFSGNFLFGGRGSLSYSFNWMRQRELCGAHHCSALIKSLQNHLICINLHSFELGLFIMVNNEQLEACHALWDESGRTSIDLHRFYFLLLVKIMKRLQWQIRARGRELSNLPFSHLPLSKQAEACQLEQEMKISFTIRVVHFN